MRKIGGSYKGLIGECLFKMAHPYAVLTRLANKSTYFNERPYILPETMKGFLLACWNSIDAFEVLLDDNGAVKQVAIYDVKLRNSYGANNALLLHPAYITPRTDSALRNAATNGVLSYISLVRLHGDWNYTITVEPYEQALARGVVAVAEKPHYNERKLLNEKLQAAGAAISPGS